MLQTNLIGRQFTSQLSKTVYTVVAVYLESGRLWILGESDNGRLTSFSFGEITLKSDVPQEAVRTEAFNPDPLFLAQGLERLRQTL